MGKYIRTPQKAAEVFEQFMSQGLPVYNSCGEELILQEDEEFRQCYDENDPVRKVLPVTWFVSNHGNLISVYHGKPEWLLRDQADKNRDTYHFQKDGKIKIISSYALVGLTFGSTRFGSAKELLDEKTVHCFGHYGEENNVQTHHITDKKKHPDLINEPSNLEFVTARAHRLCHSIPEETATVAEQQKFMQNLAEICEKECPDSIVIAIRDGDSCKLLQTHAVTLTKELYDFIRVYMNNFKKSLQNLMEL